jgi:DNA repair exonuclease SbcCD ATPase subunit
VPDDPQGQDPKNGPDPNPDPVKPPTDPPAGDDPKTFDAAYVKQLRDEAAANRKKAKDAETRLQALENEKLSDGEKRDKRLKELETEVEALRRDKRAIDVERAATKAGARHPEVIARMVDPAAEDLEKAVTEVKKQYPDLFTRPGAGSADGGSGGGAPNGQDMNQMLRRAAGRS